jgi:CRP/FNR family transcriptional regulator, cyclic AMP receptor protein
VSERGGIIASVFFLRNADDTAVRSFTALGAVRAFPKGNILYHASDECHSLFVVISGRLKTTLIGEEGREVAINVHRPGDVCGLVSSIDEGPHFGTTITIARSRLLVVPAAAFRAWVRDHPACQQDIMLELAGRLRWAYGRVGSQVLLPVKERLRSVLHEIARSEGVDDGKRHLVTTRPTHQELAERVGSTRVVITRALKELLREERSIHVEGRVLRVRITAVE